MLRGKIALRDGPLENLLGGRGGGGAGEVETNICSRENQMEKKNHARQLTLKNIHAMA